MPAYAAALSAIVDDAATRLHELFTDGAARRLPDDRLLLGAAV